MVAAELPLHIHGTASASTVRIPDALPTIGAAMILIAALLASLMPAARASRIDVVQAL